MQSKGLSRVSSNTAVGKHQFFGAQLSLWRGQWHPTPAPLPGRSHGWRSLLATVHGVAKSQTRLSDFTFTVTFLYGPTLILGRRQITYFLKLLLPERRVVPHLHACFLCSWGSWNKLNPAFVYNTFVKKQSIYLVLVALMWDLGPGSGIKPASCAL